mgnify:CR=1 FL=1
MHIASEVKSADGTRKFLIELADGKKVESVLISHKRTLCACISSQVGCAMKCSFCATGLMGFSASGYDVAYSYVHFGYNITVGLNYAIGKKNI